MNTYEYTIKADNRTNNNSAKQSNQLSIMYKNNNDWIIDRIDKHNKLKQLTIKPNK